jgi:hypothetical protein
MREWGKRGINDQIAERDKRLATQESELSDIHDCRMFDQNIKIYGKRNKSFNKLSIIGFKTFVMTIIVVTAVIIMAFIL